MDEDRRDALRETALRSLGARRTGPDHVAAPREVRVAVERDIPAMHRLRLSVRENRLTTTVLTLTDYRRVMFRTGRGWVAERAGVLDGFAIADREAAGIWALFVDPRREGEGVGSRLLDVAVDWLWARGCGRLRLVTEPGTRAAAFYARRGWISRGFDAHGETRFERDTGADCAALRPAPVG